MKLVIRFIQGVVCIAAIVAMYSFWYTQTLSSNQQTTQFLESSRGYEVLALVLQAQLTKDISTTSLDQAELTSILNKHLTPEQVKKVLQPTQIGLLDWLHGNETIDNLQLNLDITQLKNRLLADVSDPVAQFALRRAIPDTVVLTSQEQTGTPFYTFAEQFRTSLRMASIILLWSLMILGGSILVIVVLNLRKGSRLITSSAWPLATAAVLMLVIAAAFFGLETIGFSPTVELSNLNTAIIFFLSRSIAYGNVFGAACLLGLSVASIVAAKAVFRTRDKKLKDKHA
jgi:hypothetical protein